MSKYRLNFVPLNVGLFALLCVGAQFGFMRAPRRARAIPPPCRVTVDDDLANPAQNAYLEVDGSIDVGEVQLRGNKLPKGDGLSRIDEQYATMLDESRRQALLLKFPSTWRPGHRCAATYADEVHQDLKKTGGTLNRATVNTDYVLGVGDAPPEMKEIPSQA